MTSILCVSPFAFHVSGADESLLTIVRGMDRGNFNLHVALPCSSPYAERYREAGATVHPVRMMRLKRTWNPLYWIGFLLWIPLEIVGFVRLLRRESIDLVHVNMESDLSPAVAARFLDLPVVVHYRGNADDRPKLFFDVYLRLIHTLAQHIFVISRRVSEGFQKRGLQDKWEVLYNAVDTAPFLTEAQADWFATHNARFSRKRVVAYVGRLHPRKRVKDFIDAMSTINQRVPNVAFAIVGGNSDVPLEATHQKELEAHAQTLGDSVVVQFFGSVQEIHQVMQSASVLVLPSLGEGFGRVIIEAMAAGLPVVAADSGALPELLENGRYGRLVPPCQPDLLAQAIVETLNSPSTAPQVQAAREHALKHFDIRGHVAHIVAVYEKLLFDSRATRTAERNSSTMRS